MIIFCFELVALSTQTLALQSHYSWWSHLKEIVHLNGKWFFMTTVTRPSLRGMMAVKRPATPPETTAHSVASVATPTWCPCLRSTRLAAVLKERFLTIPPVSHGNEVALLPFLAWMLEFCIYIVAVPCCPEGVAVTAVSTDTLEITWAASHGAELYETRAVDGSDLILCNDTAPVCAISDLSCDSSYSVLVTPCNEISGCNRACRAHIKDTGNTGTKCLHTYSACIILYVLSQDILQFVNVAMYNKIMPSFETAERLFKL